MLRQSLPATMNEEVRYAHLRTHPKVLVPPVSILIVLIVAASVISWKSPEDVHGINVALVCWSIALVLSIITVLPSVITWRCTTFTVTSRAVRTRSGLIARNSRDLPINRISEVSTEQGILDRIFGCGTLIIADPATVDGVRFNDIPDVGRIKNMLDDLISGNAPLDTDGT